MQTTIKLEVAERKICNYYFSFDGNKSLNAMSPDFGAGEQARLLTTVLGSEAAKEQANSIVEGSATAQRGPQGPHQPQIFLVSHSQTLYQTLF